MTFVYIGAIISDRIFESKSVYFAEYFIVITAFAIVDLASIVQTLYLNHQTNKVSKNKFSKTKVGKKLKKITIFSLRQANTLTK